MVKSLWELGLSDLYGLFLTPLCHYLLGFHPLDCQAFSGFKLASVLARRSGPYFCFTRNGRSCIQRTQVLEWGGEHIFCLRYLTIVGIATSVLEQVVLDKTCETLKKVFWTFSRLQLNGIKIKKMSPCVLESQMGPDSLPHSLNGRGIFHNRVAE